MPALKKQNPIAVNVAAAYIVALKPGNCEIAPPINAPKTTPRLITELSSARCLHITAGIVGLITVFSYFFQQITLKVVSGHVLHDEEFKRGLLAW
jgi:hypothetical protein